MTTNQRALKNMLVASSVLMAVPSHAERSRFYLERYSLNNLTIDQIVIEKNLRFARIRGPDGNLFSVVEGDYIANQDGKVTSIEKCGIRLSEIHWASDKTPYVVERFWVDSLRGPECKKIK